jgi:hypothetical protein
VQNGAKLRDFWDVFRPAGAVGFIEAQGFNSQPYKR